MPTLQQLQEMLAAEPHDVFLQYAVAMAHASEGQSAEALTQFQKIVQDNPDYVAAYFQAGQLFAQEGDLEAAREIIQSGIAAANRVGDTHAAGEMAGFLEML